MAEGTRGTLVDANVILDVMTGDSRWLEWSAAHLAEAADAGPLVINQVIYGEIAHRFSRVEELDAALAPTRFIRGNLPWPAAFAAAAAQRTYRQRGGRRAAILPDFLVGAHAAVMGLRLLTRDAARYRTYFPALEVVAPTAADR